ncbi:hypothetical protein Tco_0495563 [Tanacetum coccineum]
MCLISSKNHIIRSKCQTQQPPSTPPTPPLQDTEIQSTHVPNIEVVKSVVERFTALEQAVKELKQPDYSLAVLASI